MPQRTKVAQTAGLVPPEVATVVEPMTDHVIPTPVVVYLRRRSAEAQASIAALDQQQATLTTWLAARSPVPPILRQIIEDEGDGAARPALAEAITLCKAERATLLIVSTQPIGTGQPFTPRIVSVPVTVLPQPDRPIPAVISLPPRAGDEVALYVGHQQHGYRPVYLFNPKAVPLTDVTASLGGFYTAVPHTESMIPLSGSAKAFARIEPQTGQLLELRDIMSEGESIDHIGVRFSEGGRVRHGGAYLPRLSAPRFIALTFRSVTDADPDRQAGALA